MKEARNKRLHTYNPIPKKLLKRLDCRYRKHTGDSQRLKEKID